jgi:hypothetical protein
MVFYEYTMYIFLSFSSFCSPCCDEWERLAILCYFSTATSRVSPAVGRVDLCYTLIAPCCAKIVDVAFVPFFL